MNHWVGFFSVGFFSILIGLGSRVEAQYALYLPWSQLNSLLTKEISMAETRAWPELNFQAAGFPIKFLQSSASMTGVVDLKAEGPGVLSFVSRNLKIQWQAEEFRAHGKIQRQIGGVIVNAELNASCQGLRAQLIRGLQAQGTLRLNKGADGFFEAEVSGLRLQSSSPEWQLEVESCAGAQGVEALLQKEIEKILVQPQGFVTLLQKALAEPAKKIAHSLQEKLNQQVHSLLQNHELPAVSTVEIVEAGQIGLWLMAHNGQPLKNLPEPKEDALSLYLARSVVEAQLVEKFVQSQLRTERSLNKVSALKNLFQSRFLQFFVFPDLMSFAKKTEYFFRSLNESIQVGTSSRSLHSVLPVGSRAGQADAKSTPEIQLSATILGAVFARETKNAEPTEFLAASLSTQGGLRWHVESNVLKWSWQAQKTQAKIGFSTRAPTQHRRYGRMPSGQMQAALVGLLQVREGSLKLPQLSLPEGVSSVVENVSVDQEFVTVKFSVEPGH